MKSFYSKFFSKQILLVIATSTAVLTCMPAAAEEFIDARSGGAVVNETIGGREVLVYASSRLPAAGRRGLPPRGSRALVVVLHGGGDNAERIVAGTGEAALNMNEVAEEFGFIVAYLNGTPVMRRIGQSALGWNAGGGCCGQPAILNVDDVGYIANTIDYLARQYGIDRNRVYAFGHSNGAIMAQRIVCEAGMFAAAVPVSGPLNLLTQSCPGAQGRRILAIHGSDDRNVPIEGGVGTKGYTKVSFNSEAYSEQVFRNNGASYQLDALSGVDHKIDHIDDAIRQLEGVSLAKKAARFFGLTE